MQVVVNGLMTHYQMHGTGKLVLVLHGWGDSLLGSLELQKELAQHYTVLAPDLPGFGNTQAPPTGWDLDDYANFVEALLKKLKLSSLYAVIGHSNGGAIAIRATATGKLHPERIVLLATAGIRSGKTLRRLGLQTLAKVGGMATIGLPERYRRNLRQQLYKSAKSDLLAVEHMQETFKKTVRQDVQQDAGKLEQPTLLIFGKDDEAVPLYMGQLYHELIKNSELQVVPAGHFVHLEQPVQVSSLIKDFLQ